MVSDQSKKYVWQSVRGIKVFFSFGIKSPSLLFPFIHRVGFNVKKKFQGTDIYKVISLDCHKYIFYCFMWLPKVANYDLHFENQI